MKRVSYFMGMLAFLLIIACQSPMDISNQELDQVTKAQFNQQSLKDGGDFTPGYESGNIRTSLVNLTWEESSEVDFKLYRLFRNNQLITVFNDASITSFTDDELSENTYYDYRLDVVSESGLTASDTIRIKSARWDAPSNLRVNGLSDTAVLLTWDDNSDNEDYFDVVVSGDDGLVASVTVGANTTQAIIDDLEFGSTYNFQVKIASQFESALLSSPTSLILMYNFSLSAPANLYATNNSDLSIGLFWNDYSNLETGYLIERKINAGDFIEIKNISEMNVEEYIDNDVSAYEIGDILTYRIRAYNDYNSPVQYTDYSNEYEIEVAEISDDLIYLSLTVDFDSYEASWNIRRQGTNETVFPVFQTFDSPGATVLHQLELNPGQYYVHCIDTDGDGGISGNVYKGSELLIEWDKNDYTTNGHFHFEVGYN